MPLRPDFRALPTPVFAWTKRGDELVLADFNTAAERQTQGGVAALVGKPASQLYIDQPEILRDLRECFATGETLERELPYRMLTTKQQVRIRVTYIRSDADTVLAVTEDLTAGHLAAAALRESEHRYRTLVEGAPDGIVVHRSGVILFVNDAFARMVAAASPAALVGRRVLDLVHPEDRAKVQSRVTTVSSGTAVPIAEERLLRADGGVIYAEIAGIPTTYDGAPAVQAVVRDVSDRHRAQALFVALSEQALTGISVIQNGKFRYVNPRCAELFGYTPAELIGMDADTVVAPKSLELVHAMQEQRLKSGRGKVHYRFTALRRDKSETEIEVYGTVTELDGHPTLVGTLLDASERESLEGQLRQAQKMEAVGQLAGGIAHDFNNILTAITGYADLVLADLSDATTVRADVQEIAAAARRAADLTRQLLAFSRRQTLEPRVVDIHAIVEGMSSMLRRLLPTSMNLQVKAGTDTPLVMVDRGQLEQVIMNLAVNARDAMAEMQAGRLLVETGSTTVDAESAASHPGLQPGRYAHVRVTDSGPGIPADVVPRIFEPFFTTKPAGAGTGLGLSVVYGIVKQSGGYIMVDTAPDKGAAFTVLFPALDRAAS